MKSTMPAVPLTIPLIFDHGRTVHGGSRVTSFSPEGRRDATFAELADEADRLAVGLQRFGIAPGDRVGTFCWNHQEHLAAYFAVPCIGAVLHTVNIRLFKDQIEYVINHGADRALIVDASLLAKIEPLAEKLRTVELYVIVGGEPGAGAGAGLPARAISYEELLAEPGATPERPEIDENDAASMCYTSGTTGNPRGVAYGHRSTFLHSLAQCSGAAFSLSEHDRILLIVPMFHANAWGLPYSGWMVGADFLMPGPLLGGEPLAKIIVEDQATFAPGVPTVLRDLLDTSLRNGADLSCLRLTLCGGAPVPASLIEGFREHHGVPLLQGWGMTETSPLAALSHPPRGSAPEEELRWRTKSGRPIAGVQMRIMDEGGNELPWDGSSVGEIEVRGPWVTGSYYAEDTPEKFRDGWLRTGDVGYGDEKGYVQLTDRTKDVIKSGGEWISSVELENELMGHPEVREAAVIGVPDERWDERPLACVVLAEGTSLEPADLHSWLDGRVARWWLPERWAVVSEIPKTSVGKFDKKALRADFQDGRLSVQELVQRASR
ncbi:MAG TPA: long-chain fatty acid--CoA ligase [Solirubrobacteraceae bacterium]|jgi:fatty-acyl-CoA synthase|nr:long-chain fatty acid--CoA ligase [Solirubrobacteraceae bacterium]